MSEGECVYLLCLSWQPCAIPPFQAIFHPAAAVHTAEGDKGGRGGRRGEVGRGVPWITVGELSVLGRERDFAMILCSYGEQFLRLLTLFNRFVWLGMQEQDPTEADIVDN